MLRRQRCTRRGDTCASWTTERIVAARIAHPLPLPTGDAHEIFRGLDTPLVVVGGPHTLTPSPASTTVLC
ncbi:hypothetical protein [Haloactinospora alba]|uniref:hypothetical protein n=1 Tax=Haloactinospora alba TaxID=405555 RepID=UPI0011513E6D|nr:hypothetical protein [Haloactinospora alba]